jgi:hypothetical protein
MQSLRDEPTTGFDPFLPVANDRLGACQFADSSFRRDNYFRLAISVSKAGNLNRALSASNLIASKGPRTLAEGSTFGPSEDLIK